MSTAWLRPPKERFRQVAPTVAVLLVAVLSGLSLGTGLLIIRHFKADATATSRLYSGVFGGLNDPDPGSEYPWHHVSSARVIAGRCCFCSSVPYSINVGPT